MSDVENSEFIRKSEFFQGFTEQDIIDFSAISSHLSFTDGQFIIEEGDEASKDLFVIVSGTVVAKIKTQEPDVANVNVMSVGNIFGELALVIDSKRSASIVATSEVEVLKVSRSDFEVVAGRNSHLGMIFYRNIAKVLAERIKNTNLMLRHTIIWGW